MVPLRGAASTVRVTQHAGYVLNVSQKTTFTGRPTAMSIHNPLRIGRESPSWHNFIFCDTVRLGGGVFAAGMARMNSVSLHGHAQQLCEAQSLPRIASEAPRDLAL